MGTKKREIKEGFFGVLRRGFCSPPSKRLHCVHPSSACKPEPLPGGRVWLPRVRWSSNEGRGAPQRQLCVFPPQLLLNQYLPIIDRLCTINKILSNPSFCTSTYLAPHRLVW